MTANGLIFSRSTASWLRESQRNVGRMLWGWWSEWFVDLLWAGPSQAEQCPKGHPFQKARRGRMPTGVLPRLRILCQPLPGVWLPGCRQHGGKLRSREPAVSHPWKPSLWGFFTDIYFPPRPPGGHASFPCGLPTPSLSRPMDSLGVSSSGLTGT